MFSDELPCTQSAVLLLCLKHFGQDSAFVSDRLFDTQHRWLTDTLRSRQAGGFAGN